MRVLQHKLSGLNLYISINNKANTVQDINGEDVSAYVAVTSTQNNLQTLQETSVHVPQDVKLKMLV